MSFRSNSITARIPLQSPIGSEEPIGDSFPPGEAIGASRWTSQKAGPYLVNLPCPAACHWVLPSQGGRVIWTSKPTSARLL